MPKKSSTRTNPSPKADAPLTSVIAACAWVRKFWRQKGNGVGPVLEHMPERGTSSNVESWASSAPSRNAAGQAACGGQSLTEPAASCASHAPTSKFRD